MSHALIPGSYDPITNGHMDVIARAAALYDRVTVAVMTNDMYRYVPDAPHKQYCFSMETRYAMVVAACADLANVTVVSAGGLLIDLFDRVGADCIVKGIRSAADLAYEQKHALWNRAHNPRAETLYLPADTAYDYLSSTLVRERLSAGLRVDDLVPPAILPYLVPTHPGCEGR